MLLVVQTLVTEEEKRGGAAEQGHENMANKQQEQCQCKSWETLDRKSILWRYLLAVLLASNMQTASSTSPTATAQPPGSFVVCVLAAFECQTNLKSIFP